MTPGYETSHFLIYFQIKWNCLQMPIVKLATPGYLVIIVAPSPGLFYSLQATSWSSETSTFPSSSVTSKATWQREQGEVSVTADTVHLPVFQDSWSPHCISLNQPRPSSLSKCTWFLEDPECQQWYQWGDGGWGQTLATQHFWKCFLQTCLQTCLSYSAVKFIDNIIYLHT